MEVKKKIKTCRYIIDVFANSEKYKHYRPLKALLQYKEFLNLFNHNHRQMITKLFIKNDTLIILVKHHIAYMELNHDNTKKIIKSLIKNYTLAKPMSNFAKVKNIKILSDKNFISNNSIFVEHKKTHLELSNGNFKNHFKNPILYNKFEELRKLIKNA
ncbi:Uncharacterised protein [Campylobacter lari]|uniref:Uncharacterized protein n=1 Tax=Campylobacter lari NCTC 11845 TaxID=1388749 RepID=A0A0A8HX99_CAMLA|nr:hypothetical protein [Campylobacter lari]AJD01395.1 hypothetical protein UPTC3659_0527 [Campylobacter lari NCTC 11845]MCR6543400.1 hypothetical protein [Campylobacter lari]STA73811.1 Uncharacterised protein [Campylobacter lari]VEJ05961.1 Uncharacterised protein [Campylobacter lari]